MLQQTQVQTVVPYYERFLARFPDVRQLAQADEQDVLKLWEGLGYYSRARNLGKAARLVSETMQGHLPADRYVLKKLPGVGDYIAAAVASIAYGIACAVVDGNVKRVLARLFQLKTPVNQSAGNGQFQQIADRLLDSEKPGRHNQAMMELGALVCRPSEPLCHGCPVNHHCSAHINMCWDRYPIKQVKPKAPVKNWVAAVVIKQGRLLLTKRPSTGLLAGMWEFPGREIANGEERVLACRNGISAATGLQVGKLSHVVSVRHAYTHFKLEMDLFVCRWRRGRVILDGPADFKWVLPDQLNDFPLHKAVHKTLQPLRDILAE
jgi:A/G-specific adenine glycosylase